MGGDVAGARKNGRNATGGLLKETSVERALLDWVTQTGDGVGAVMVRWLVTGQAPRLPVSDVGWARPGDAEEALRW